MHIQLIPMTVPPAVDSNEVLGSFGVDVLPLEDQLFSLEDFETEFVPELVDLPQLPQHTPSPIAFELVSNLPELPPQTEEQIDKQVTPLAQMPEKPNTPIASFTMPLPVQSSPEGQVPSPLPSGDLPAPHQTTTIPPSDPDPTEVPTSQPEKRTEREFLHVPISVMNISQDVTNPSPMTPNAAFGTETMSPEVKAPRSVLETTLQASLLTEVRAKSPEVSVKNTEAPVAIPTDKVAQSAPIVATPVTTNAAIEIPLGDSSEHYSYDKAQPSQSAESRELTAIQTTAPQSPNGEPERPLKPLEPLAPTTNVTSDVDDSSKPQEKPLPPQNDNAPLTAINRQTELPISGLPNLAPSLAPTELPIMIEQAAAESTLRVDLQSHETPRTAPTPTTTLPPPPVARAIAQQLSVALTADASQPIEIALSPEELGRVKLSLSPNEQGMTISIVAERPETLDLMRRNAALLTQEFTDSGYTSLTLNFAQSNRDQQQGADQNQANDYDFDFARDSSEGPSPHRIDLTTSTGVDIRV
ncbi:flagellar hook-length control protein FliK [Falsihalocynthiibacter sp. SS001]|uniref:flagellar hook-length control protein FliK n=1 Tax=Falsihalocynthiibacter sp. SS001 TaxID=3349698 RepID=UPI0036D30038